MLVSILGKQTYIYTGGHALDPALPTIAFVHGGDQDHSTWALQSRYFAFHAHNVLVPDLPGHGRSHGPPLESIDAMASWLAAALDAVQVDRAAVVGHSMGALVTLEFAATRGPRATRIVLLGASAPMPVADALLAAAYADDPQALDMINIWSHSVRAQVGANTVPGMWMLGMNRRLMERQARGVLHQDFKACNEYARGAQAAAAIRCPTLVIMGSRDVMTPPRASQDLLARLSGAEVVTLRGSGHALLAEAPDAVLDALIRFLRGEQ